MKTKISIISPTRKRISCLNRLLNSIKKTASNLSQVEIVFIVDDDDDESLKFLKNTINSDELIKIKIVETKKNSEIFSNLWNLGLAVSDGEILIPFSDDAIFCTKNWDNIIIDEFKNAPNDKLNIYHFWDGQPISRTRVGFCAIHKNFVNVLGWLSPPYFNGDWGDYYLTELANGINRRIFFPQIETKHLHVDFGLSKKDTTYVEHKIRRENSNTYQVFLDTKKERDIQISKLLNFIKNNE